MRPVQFLGHILDIGGEVGRDAVRGIGGADPVDIFRAALLGDLEPLAKVEREQRERVGHDVRKDTRALAAAGNEQAKDAILVERRIALSAKRQYGFADGIADEVDFGLRGGGDAGDIGVRGGDGVDMRASSPVDPAEDGVLLMDQCRDSERARGKQGRQCRITTETDDRRWFESLQQFAGHGAATADGKRGLYPAYGATLHPPGGEDVDLTFVELPRDFRAAFIGDQRDAMTALHQLCTKRIGGDHVAAGTPGGENIVATDRHRWVHPERFIPERFRGAAR